MFAPRGGLTPAHTAALTFAAAAIFAAALAAAAATSALLESLLEVDPRLRPAASADAIFHPYFTANFSDRLVASGDLLRQDEKLEALSALIRQVPRGATAVLLSST